LARLSYFLTFPDFKPLCIFENFCDEFTFDFETADDKNMVAKFDVVVMFFGVNFNEFVVRGHNLLSSNLYMSIKIRETNLKVYLIQ
jgi:hypothetical protein